MNGRFPLRSGGFRAAFIAVSSGISPPASAGGPGAEHQIFLLNFVCYNAELRTKEVWNEEEMTEDWKVALLAGLKGRGRLVILGVGNPLKGDDAAGLLCVEQVMKSIPAKARPGIRLFRTYDVPENYTGKIRKFKPSQVLIIDAALAGLKPGDVFILEKEKIAIEEISSHKIPLMVLISYLEQSIGCKVTVLGIQAKDLSFGAPITPTIKAAIKTVADVLTASIGSRTCQGAKSLRSPS